MNKEELRKQSRFFSVDPNDLETFEEWAEYLESILNGKCSMI